MHREGCRSKSAEVCPAGKRWTGQSPQSGETFIAVIAPGFPFAGEATQSSQAAGWAETWATLGILVLGALSLLGEQQHPSFPPPRLFQPLSPSQKAHPSHGSSCPAALPFQPHHQRAGSRGGCKGVVRGRAAGLSSSSFTATRGCFSPYQLRLAHRHSLSSLHPSPLSEQKAQSLLASSQLQNYPLER